MGVAEVERIVDRYGGKRSSLIGILHEIQARYKYLPEEALRQVADRLDMKFPHVYGVATLNRGVGIRFASAWVLPAMYGAARGLSMN